MWSKKTIIHVLSRLYGSIQHNNEELIMKMYDKYI